LREQIAGIYEGLCPIFQYPVRQDKGEMSSLSLYTKKSPLSALVLFMICLGIAGSVIAGAYYTAVDLPQQKQIQPPSNSMSECISDCMQYEYKGYLDCAIECHGQGQ
jgi:hypothetical protein